MNQLPQEKKQSSVQHAKEILKKEGYTFSHGFVERRNRALSKFPLLFTFLGAFGLVTIFYGIEKALDATPIADKPYIMIIVGVVILLVTGTLYKKLDG